MKRALVLTILLAGLLLVLPAAPGWLSAGQAAGTDRSAVNAGFNAALRRYDDGRYEEAASLLGALVDAGVEDAVVYYNLGNASFKQGDLGGALLAYRRAARLAPRDADIQANLALARSLRQDRLAEEGPPSLAGLSVWLTLDEWSLLALGAWFLSALLWVWRGLLRRPAVLREGLLYALIVCLVLCAGAGAMLGGRLISEASRPEGVILASETQVASAPGGGVAQFTLHAGAEVSILESRPNWTRLALPGGSQQGWVPADALACIACRPD